MNYLALTTVIFAVCATLSTFKGGGYSTRAILSQSQASDQWGYYQSKSIKGYLYDLQKQKMEIEQESSGAAWPAAVREKYKKLLEDYASKIRKYEGEKTSIQDEAKRLEGVRDDSRAHSQAFGFAVIFLQIAILLSSIAGLLKNKVVWVFGLVVGTAGMVCFANGFFLFI